MILRGLHVVSLGILTGKQPWQLKVRFIAQLRESQPGPWTERVVLALIGNNLKERRNRLRQSLQKKGISNRTRPYGCTKESWEAILAENKDSKKASKSEKCKVVVGARTKVKGY